MTGNPHCRYCGGRGIIGRGRTRRKCSCTTPTPEQASALRRLNSIGTNYVPLSVRMRLQELEETLDHYIMRVESLPINELRAVVKAHREAAGYTRHDATGGNWSLRECVEVIISNGLLLADENGELRSV